MEEYDMKTHELISRKWKKQSSIKETSWIYEVGEPTINKSEDLFTPSSKNVIS